MEFSVVWCFGLDISVSKHWIFQCLDYNRPPLLYTNANPCMSLSQHLYPLYMISRELISLFVHYYEGDVLEYLPGLVDFMMKLNVNDKQRGALSKLQHFVVNRMSRDIMSATLCIHPYILHLNDVSSWWSCIVDLLTSSVLLCSAYIYLINGGEERTFHLNDVWVLK